MTGNEMLSATGVRKSPEILYAVSSGGVLSANTDPDSDHQQPHDRWCREPGVAMATTSFDTATAHPARVYTG